MSAKNNPVIFENEYLKIEVDTLELVIKVEWLATTEDMTDNEYKNAVETIAGYIKEYNVKTWIGDTINLKKVITVDLQEWQGGIISNLTKAGLEKLAVIAPEEFFTNLSVEQSVDEILNFNGNKLAIQYFNTLKNAKEWI